MNPGKRSLARQPVQQSSSPPERRLRAEGRWLIVTPSDAPDLVIVALIAGIGATVLLARPREPANVYFAAFMFLIGWGIFAGTQVIHATDAYRAFQSGAVGVEEALWRDVVTTQRLFWIPYVFDPLALLYFASIYPRRNAAHRPAVLLPFAGVALVLLAVDVLAPVPRPDRTLASGTFVGPFGHGAWRTVVLLYMLAAYVTALALLARERVSGGEEITRARAKLLLVGLGAAVLSRVGLAVTELVPVALLFETQDQRLGIRLVALAVAFACTRAFYALARRSSAEPWTSLLKGAERWTHAAIAAVGLVIWLPGALLLSLGVVDGALKPDALWDVLFVLERAVYSSRWLVFGGLVAFSILRYQLFDLSRRAKRAALETLLACGAVGLVALAAAALLPADLATLSPTMLVVGSVSGTFLLVRALEGARRPLARLLPEGDDAVMRLRKMEVYRAAVETAAGRDEPSLRRLAADLGLDDEDAAAVERLVRAPPARGALLPGVVVEGRYRILRELARGGGGRVFLAEDPLLGRTVALKEVREARDPGTITAALAEARAAGRLSHPHVVVVFDVLRWSEDFLIVMEHAGGGSLEEALQARGRLPVEEALRLARHVASGLAAVHAQGIVHGDVKPGNVVLDAAGQAKLTDFGIARALRADAQTLPRGCGAAGGGGLTPRYAAPEVLEGALGTPASDVYSAACLLMDLLLGPEGARAAAARVRSVEALGAPPRLVHLLSEATAADPARRQPDGAALLRALEDVEASA